MSRSGTAVVVAWVIGLTAVIAARSHAPGVSAPAPPAPEQVAAASGQRPAGLPPPATHAVDFATDVAPLFARSCVRCHARGQSKGKFSLETRDRLLAGGGDGPAIVPGNSADSLLVHLVAGLDPDRPMPEKGTKLSAAEIGLVRAWIDQGARWDDRVSFARQPPRNLDPRTPTLPPADGTQTHPIDRLLAAHPAGATANAPRADDRVLARRLSLDLVGLLPSPETVDAFAADTRPDKVERLARALLSDRAAYATHWLTFWNDLLRNDYRGPGYIDGGRRQISGWLYTALATRMPFDEFVASLVDPGPDNEGFTKGIVWRGVVNASQTPPMQAAQNVSQVFMGVNLKCASCHDSFINDWQLADAYGLAGVYADAPLEMVECDRPTGRTAPLKFLYPSLGTIAADDPRAARVAQLASLMTERRNGRLPRTIVNRLWARLFGRGLVEPLDDMDRGAWHPDLLDWLAEDLVAHDYDLTHSLTRMVTSQAYQRAAVNVDLEAAPPSPTLDVPVPAFRGPAVRRLTAEQFADAIGRIAGVWARVPAGDFDTDVAEGHDVPAAPTTWIWRDDRAQAQAETWPVDYDLVFRATVVVDTPVRAATLLVVSPQSFSLHVGDEKVGTIGRSTRARLIDLTDLLSPGRHEIRLEATRPAPGAAPSTPPREPGYGVLAQLHLRDATPQGALRIVPLGVETWTWRTANVAWRPVAPARATRDADGLDARQLRRSLAAAALTGRTRAALSTATPLTTALGRPGREQVVTLRTETPTTLQALELANGETLARLLRQAAVALRQEPDTTPAVLVTRLFARALARPPTPREQALAVDLLGPDLDVDAIEDLLWTVTMLPEFRLVH